MGTRAIGPVGSMTSNEILYIDRKNILGINESSYLLPRQKN